MRKAVFFFRLRARTRYGLGPSPSNQRQNTVGAKYPVTVGRGFRRSRFDWKVMHCGASSRGLAWRRKSRD